MTVSLPPKLYFRIGEVAGLVGVEPHVLRYWEREFRSIRPTKSAKGQRVYSRKDVEALIVVKDLLYAQGFTIAGAKKRLQRTPEPTRATAGLAAPLSAPPTAESAAESGAESAPQGHAVQPHLDQRVEPHAPQMFLGRNAEEALLRTLEQREQAHTPREPLHEQAQGLLHAQVALQVAPQVGAQLVSAARTNGARTRSEVEGTRTVLTSLRAEVEALLSELGG